MAAMTRRRAERVIAAIENQLYGTELVLMRYGAGAVYSLSVSPDGKRVLTSGADKTMRLWDADTGKCLRLIEGWSKCVRSTAFSPDGKLILSDGGDDQCIRLWDAATGAEIKSMITGGPASVAFGPEGKAISV